MSKRSQAENRDPGRAGDGPGSSSAVNTFVATAIVLHGIFTVGLPALILDLTRDLAILNPDVGPTRWLGAGLAGFGIYLYLWSAVHLLRRRKAKGPNLGRKSSKVLQDSTICASCRCAGPCWTVP